MANIRKSAGTKKKKQAAPTENKPTAVVATAPPKKAVADTAHADTSAKKSKTQPKYKHGVKQKEKLFSAYNITVTGLLTALMIALEASGLAMFNIVGVSITVLMSIVSIGAVTCGKYVSTVLGGVFGAISFWECFSKDALGVMLLDTNPVLTAVMCFVPRILAGFLAGLFFEVISKKVRDKIWLCGLTGLV
ncbi:MAG: hypothetical protein LBN42_04035, partial [Oscillospiraceae bacterium]|nr:hypothetical protein [Oscillospiraceae bacterium]